MHLRLKDESYKAQWEARIESSDKWYILFDENVAAKVTHDIYTG